MSTALVFVDLDETLFSSRHEEEPADLLHVAADSSGRPLSYMNRRQQAFFNWINRDSLLVPTTGRSVEAYRRVNLQFRGPAICAFGGVIADGEKVNAEEWNNSIVRAACLEHETSRTLLEVSRNTAVNLGFDVRSRIIYEGGTPLYISIKHNQRNTDELKQLYLQVQSILPSSWYSNLNANNLALLPLFLSKDRAVQFLMEQMADDYAFVLGLGDSFSDSGFMGLCHYALSPTDSQLFHQFEQRLMREYQLQ